MQKVINLDPIDYYTQRNNKINPVSACMPTARAMFYRGNNIKFVNDSDLQDDDFFYKWLISDDAWEFAEKKYPVLISRGYPPNEIHGMYHSFLDPRVAGRRTSDFVLTLTFDDIVDKLKNGQVIMTSGIFAEAGIFGHAFCFIGYEKQESGVRLIIADPWGDYRTDYDSDKGYGVQMSKEDFYKHVKPEGDKKWGHVLI